MLAVVRSSPYSGAPYRNKAGVTCANIAEIQDALTDIWLLAMREQTDETIRIEIKQEG